MLHFIDMPLFCHLKLLIYLFLKDTIECTAIYSSNSCKKKEREKKLVVGLIFDINQYDTFANLIIKKGYNSNRIDAFNRIIAIMQNASTIQSNYSSKL